MASLDRWNIGGNLEYSRCCSMSGAPGKDKPPPTTRTLPYSFFFTSSDAKTEIRIFTPVGKYYREAFSKGGKDTVCMELLAN